MVDTFTPAAAPVTGIVTPLLQQAYQQDPRVALARVLQANANGQANVPAYNTMSTLAKALTEAAPGLIDYSVAKDYQQRQADLGDTFKKALVAGTSGIPAGTDQSGNATAAVPSGYGALAQVLTNSSDPVAQQLGMQFGVQGLATTQAARLQLLQKLAEKNLTLDANNQVVPMPGAAQAAADVAKPTKQMEADVATQQAINTEKGTAPIKTQQAINTAAGTAPIETFKDLFKPVVNRVTGEVTIPGMDQATTTKIMGAFGVTPQALGVTGQQAPQPPQAAPSPAPAPTPAAPGVSAPAAPPAKPPLPVTPAAATTVTPAAAPTTAPEQPSGPVPVGTKKPIDEVPTVKLPTGEMAPGPTTLSAGRDPIAIKAGEGAVEQAQEQYKATADAAKSAVGMRASLATMKRQVLSGDVTPSATAPARYWLAGYLNAVGGPNLAQSVTGLNPASADVVTKESTRMGLSYARQTEGAREAVAGINIALKGNPQLGQTKPGFLKILDLLDAGAQHDVAAQTYGSAFFQKNGHYLGSKEWFDQNHPPSEFTSKVMPYDLPRLPNGTVDPSQLQTNTTYIGKNGPGIWNGQGFLPVAQ